MLRARAGCRRHLAVAASASLAAAVAIPLAPAAAAAPGASGPAVAPATAAPTSTTIEPALARELADGRTDFFVRFGARADLDAASRIDDWAARGAAVVRALRKTAETSQAGVVARLQERGLAYESLYVTNAVYVRSAGQQVAQTLAGMPGVTALEAPDTVQLEKPVKTDAPPSLDGVEWGIADIKADQVWSEFGVRGEGVVVGNIDSGVQFDHPAVVAQYRGNTGGGTFDHDHNWFDPAEICGSPSLEPCDNNGHGTHTMGTMVGDDGAGNQIGVAPAATWIAAKGCETNGCSELSLSESAQWMLAPTDLAGENPDPALRPNIINNSWGGPGGDTWYQDFVTAWVAGGQFPAFSNGNAGPGCDSAGSPGDYPESYSAGNYDINGAINSTSSRGPGIGDELKPNISAPGTAVRSSVPTDDYAAFSGTSMASPHVAGTVALLWAAAPTLIGDIDGTSALLDGTARDTDDTTCGGTAADNNVFGEGKLDALAAMQGAPIGDAGQLSGTVTDAASGDPLAGVEVSVTGASERSTTTGDDGTYLLNLTVGAYDVTASAFGYADASVGVVVTAGETTTQDLQLSAVESATLSGLVRDGSGHGWPLYAKVSATGTPLSTYTNPETGRYQLELPVGAEYEVRVEPLYPGYEVLTEPVQVDGDVSHDLRPQVDELDCLAPGYQPRVEGLFETFDGTTAPEGWTVTDEAGTEQVWSFDDPGGRGNLTGGEGGFAIVDSDFYGGDGAQDTSLVAPSVDLTDDTNPVVQFRTDFRALGDDVADVDVSLDGGTAWENVWSQPEDVRGPTKVRIPLPQAAGQADVRVRFHFYDASYAWWWQVDDVIVGTSFCDKARGGLVLGQVSSSLTGDALDGATVTSDDAPAETATTGPTPDDERLGDGWYWMFSSVTGAHPFTATSGSYAPQTQPVDVAADWATRADFALDSGLLRAGPRPVKGTTELGGSVTDTFTVTNDGNAPATFELGERAGDFVIQGPDGGRTRSDDIASARGAKAVRIPADVTPLQDVSSAPDGSGATTADRPVVADEPWVDLPSYPSPIMDNVAGYHGGLAYSFGGTEAGMGATAASYVYDPAALTWEPIADMPEGRQKPAAAFVDGVFVVTGGWGESGDPVAGTASYDPASDSWSTGADNPAPYAASGTAVLDGKLYAVGGCTDVCGATDVLRYDPQADAWEQLADYPEDTAWTACGGIGGQVLCAGGLSEAGTSTATYAYDPGADSWTPVADMPVDLWGSSYWAANDQLVVAGGAVDGSTAITNEVYAYDPAADAWTQLPSANNALYRGAGTCGLYKIGGSEGNFASTDSAELLPGYDQCGRPADVPWLRARPAAAELAPGESTTVTVTMNSRRLTQPGRYTARLVVGDDTPFSVAPLTVVLTANAPATWGRLGGLVRGVACDGTAAPLAGATVDVSRGAAYTLTTDADGVFAVWMPGSDTARQVIVAKDGYRPQVREVEIGEGGEQFLRPRLQKAGC